MEECLKVGVVFGDEELVVDVAEVEERLVATETILLVVLVELLTDSAPPLGVLLLLVPDSVGGFGWCLVGGFGVIAFWHRVLYFKFKYSPSMDDLATTLTHSTFNITHLLLQEYCKTWMQISAVGATIRTFIRFIRGSDSIPVSRTIVLLL